MPELPEVETIARGLASRVTGDVIESVWLGSKPEPLKSAASEIVATLESKRIAGVRRVGKHIVFDLEDGERRILARPEKIRSKIFKSGTDRASGHSAVDRAFGHDRTNAGLQIRRGNRETYPCGCPPGIGQGTEVCGSATFWTVKRDPGFEAPGSEPLEVELDRFVELFRGRKTPIKSALLNQKLLSGVGNIYADESLFRAGIRPRRRAASLTRKELSLLYAAVQEVLKEAISAGGSSISNYVDADGEEGFFQLQHRVYGRENEPCLVCKTPIKRVVIGGRSSHYCPKCQK